MLSSELVSTIVSCNWLHQNLHLENLIVLDTSVNTEDSRLAECIPNSIHFDLKVKFTDSKAKFPNTIPSKEQFETEARRLRINNDSVIVVYDNKGIYWSARVWWLFKTFGFKNIAVLDGGLPEWKKEGYEMQQGYKSTRFKMGDFSAEYNTSKMLYYRDMREASKNEAYKIIDARSEERFKCLIPEPRTGLRSGTIPNSENLPYTNLLDGNCLKPKDELISIFNTFTINEKPLAFYCGSGITACILALAAEISGYDQIGVYDGSWTEYGTLTT